MSDALLSLLACDKDVSPGSLEGVGYAALPAVVASLKALDLDRTASAAQRVGTVAAGGIGVWAAALVDARRGADAQAVARLRALPPVPPEDVERASFTLALFGAAIPDDDRLLLAAIGREAMLEAAADGAADAMGRLARALAALDVEWAAGALHGHPGV